MRFMLCVKPYNNNTGNGLQQDVAVMTLGKPIFVRVLSTEIGLDSLKWTQKRIKSNTLLYPRRPTTTGPRHTVIYSSRPSVIPAGNRSPPSPQMTGVMSV